MTQQALKNAPTVIVLAAGRGERFRASVAQSLAHDRGDVKLDAPLAGVSVRTHVLRSVQRSGLPYHVVEAAQTAHIPQAGMGDSIAIGVKATEAQANGWLILPADLPLVQPDTLLAVAAALQQHAVVVPLYRGQKGHPVGFSKACAQALMALKGDRGASSVVQAHQPLMLPTEDQGCVHDVDTLELLLQAEMWLMQQKM